MKNIINKKEFYMKKILITLILLFCVNNTTFAFGEIDMIPDEFLYKGSLHLDPMSLGRFCFRQEQSQ